MGSQVVLFIFYELDGVICDYICDILVVGGEYDGDFMYIMVNYWFFCSGGEVVSVLYCNVVVLMCKNFLDFFCVENLVVKIVIMGDFNDDFILDSVDEVLVV